MNSRARDNAWMAESRDQDWHLRDWMTFRGKRQSALVNELGWTKNRAHLVWHGKQPYTREDVNTVSAWLGIEPFELLMAPPDAMALRAIRQSALQIAAEETRRPYSPDESKTGTDG